MSYASKLRAVLRQPITRRQFFWAAIGCFVPCVALEIALLSQRAEVQGRLDRTNGAAERVAAAQKELVRKLERRERIPLPVLRLDGGAE